MTPEQIAREILDEFWLTQITKLARTMGPGPRAASAARRIRPTPADVARAARLLTSVSRPVQAVAQHAIDSRRMPRVVVKPVSR